MGHTKLRKLINQSTKWTDSDTPRHKHDFSIEAYVRIRYALGSFGYYHVMMCSKCKSFRGIPKQGAASGMIDPSSLNKALPIIDFESPHAMHIGFEDIHLVK